MAKGARASSRKANKARLKSKVFGPIEHARTQRLSAKLQEIVTQPPVTLHARDSTHDTNIEGATEDTGMVSATQATSTEEMDIDQVHTKDKPPSKSGKGRIEKRSSSRRRASIVFPRYKSGMKHGKIKSK